MKKEDKIWIYIIIGVSIIVIGLLSWGFATNWEFIPENTAKSSSSGSGEIPSSAKCGDQNCKDGEICVKNTIGGDGTKSKCCKPGEVLDAQGDMCCPINMINPKTGVCCENGQICEWKNKPGQKVCCDKCKDGLCYTDCGNTPCLNDDENCIVDQSTKKKYCRSSSCEFKPENKATPQISFDCEKGVCPIHASKCENNKCQSDTLGICPNTPSAEDCNKNFNSDTTFLYQNTDQLPSNTQFVYKTTIDKTDKAECTATDCNNRLKLAGDGTVFYIKDKQPTCTYIQTDLQNFPHMTPDLACPLPDKAGCCHKSDTNKEFSGQVCISTEDKVCAIDKSRKSRDGTGYLSTCVDRKDCVDPNGQEVCNGVGSCILQDDGTTGKCDCASDGNNYCAGHLDFKNYEFNVTNVKYPDLGPLTWRFIPFNTCSSSLCTVDNVVTSANLIGGITLGKRIRTAFPNMILINDGTIYQITDNRFKNYIAGDLTTVKINTGLNNGCKTQGMSFALNVQATTTGDAPDPRGVGDFNQTPIRQAYKTIPAWSSISQDTVENSDHSTKAIDSSFNQRILTNFVLLQEKDNFKYYYIFAFGYWLFTNADSYDTLSDISPYFVQVDSNKNISLTTFSETSTQFKLTKADKRCCEVDDNCDSTPYCQLYLGEGMRKATKQYGITSTSPGICKIDGVGGYSFCPTPVISECDQSLVGWTNTPQSYTNVTNPGVTGVNHGCGLNADGGTECSLNCALETMNWCSSVGGDANINCRADRRVCPGGLDITKCSASSECPGKGDQDCSYGPSRDWQSINQNRYYCMNGKNKGPTGQMYYPSQLSFFP